MNPQTTNDADNTLEAGCEKRLVRESSNTVVRHLDRIIHQLDEAAGPREYSADALWLEEVREYIRRLESELDRYKDREKHCATMDQAEKLALIYAIQEIGDVVCLSGLASSPAQIVAAVKNLHANAERIHGGAGDGKPRETLPPLDGASCSAAGVWYLGPESGGGGTAGPCTEDYPSGAWWDGDHLLVAVNVINNQTGMEWTEYHAVIINCDEESFSVEESGTGEDIGWGPESWAWWMRIPSPPNSDLT